MEDLDNGIQINKKEVQPIKNKHNIIGNPFFNTKLKNPNDELDNEIEIDLTFLSKNYNRVLILCLLGKKPVNSEFYNERIDSNILNEERNNLILIESSIKILKNVIHFNNVIQVSSVYLELYNHQSLELGGEELVLPILNINFMDVMTYLNHYDGFFSMEDVFKVKLLEQYFNTRERNCILSSNFESMLMGLKESEYWTYYHNCMLKMTIPLLKRSFNLHIIKNSDNENLEKTLESLRQTEPKDNNYLQDILRPQKYVDASSTIKKNGYKIYRVLYDYSDIIQKYKLFNNLIISKKYCHLALNNINLLKELKPMIHKYIGLYRYIFGYAWLTFYLEESIKKSYIESKDRFVFDIDTASELPVFPVVASDITLNPYLPVMIKKDVIDGKNNCLGFPFINTDISNYGITNLENFKKNLNIYTTGYSNKSIFKDLDWSNLALTGSSLAACLPKRHPLIALFEATCDNQDETLFRFFNEYYAAADIDIMCNNDSKFDFMDTVFKTFETVKKNILSINIDAEKEHIKLESETKAALIINEKFIRKYICKNNISFEYILSHLKEPDVIELFYPYYMKAKEELNNEVIKVKNLSNEEEIIFKEFYKDYFKYVEKENIVLIFTKSNHKFEKATENINGYKKEKTDYSFLNDDIIKDEDVDFDKTDPDEDWEEASNKHNDIIVTGDNEDDVLFKVNEGLKYKIKSPFLQHTLEIFQIKYKDFFSTVAKFHLPCVRGYYNGDNVYLLPSCISAHMTFINMDYKYFAGSKDPIEIINKYRMRGYGTILNDEEKIHLIEYSSQIIKWKNLYNVDTKNTESVNSMLGFLNYDHKIYKPRLFNVDNYYDCNPVSDNYNNVNLVSYITTEEEYMFELNRLYGYNESPSSSIQSIKFTTIKDSGYVNPVKKWVMDAVWDNVNTF